MKKTLAIMLAAAIILTSLIGAPIAAFADNGINFTVLPGNAGEITNINVDITGVADPEPLILWVFKFDGSFEELLHIGNTTDGAGILQYLVYGIDPGSEPVPDMEGFFWVDSDPWQKNIQLILSKGRYYALILSPLVFEEAFEDDDNGDLPPEAFLVREFYVGTAHVAAEQWIRNVQMTCYHAWINEDKNFEFVFWWEYKNNNWVKIYDMEGNEVFAIDMKYGNARFEAELPDGMYTVKTFHSNDTPIQEFIIGKP